MENTSTKTSAGDMRANGCACNSIRGQTAPPPFFLPPIASASYRTHSDPATIKETRTCLSLDHPGSRIVS